MDTSVSWQQRFQNYECALKKLRKGVKSVHLTVEKESILIQIYVLGRESYLSNEQRGYNTCLFE